MTVWASTVQSKQAAAAAAAARCVCVCVLRDRIRGWGSMWGWRGRWGAKVDLCMLLHSQGGEGERGIRFHPATATLARWLPPLGAQPVRVFLTRTLTLARTLTLSLPEPNLTLTLSDRGARTARGARGASQSTRPTTTPAAAAPRPHTTPARHPQPTPAPAQSTRRTPKAGRGCGSRGTASTRPTATQGPARRPA